MRDEARRLLHELIETCRDGEAGFTRAAQRISDESLKRVFEEGATRCHSGGAELQSMMRAMGGGQDDDGVARTAAGRGWLNSDASEATRDALAVLDEVERGENYAKGRYAQALQFDLPASIRGMLQRQFLGVLANHERVRYLRNQYRSRAAGAAGKGRR